MFAVQGSGCLLCRDQDSGCVLCREQGKYPAVPSNGKE